MTGYSAKVDLILDCGEYGRIPLGAVGPDEVRAAENQNVPPCDATLIVIVDGEVTSNPVRCHGFNNGREARVVSA